MSKNLNLERYLGIPYKKDAYPEILERGEEVLGGVNCITLVHWVVRDLFRKKLPPQLWLYEMLRNEYPDYISPLLCGETPKQGDVYLVGRRRDFYQQIHAAIHTGIETNSGPLLLHANGFSERRITTWPLSQFLNSKRYPTIFQIMRVKL